MSVYVHGRWEGVCVGVYVCEGRGQSSILCVASFLSCCLCTFDFAHTRSTLKKSNNVAGQVKDDW